MRPFSSTSAALINPAAPAPASMWPMFVFTEPMTSGTSRPGRSAVPSASASTGSPTAVPVPWASAYPISAGFTPASRQTRSISALCDSRLGTVMPAVRPSWLTPLARITAWMGSPARSAAASGLSSTTPTPSARTNPSAAASNALHRPSGETIAMLLKAWNGATPISALTPPAIASEHSPFRRLRQAAWTATSADEHAVSIAMLGPRKLKQ